MNKRKLFQVLKKQNHRKIVLIRNSNVKNNRGITLIALVISIIVMLILAGVSLNAVIGDNGIITQAQNATYMQSIAVLEEYLNSYYVEHYEEMANEESKVLTLTSLQPDWFYIPANEGVGALRYITDSDGNALYLIKKSGLPEEIKSELKGGDAGNGEYSDYAGLNDVYGVTSNLKVYYCQNGKDTILGVSKENLDLDNPNRIVFDENSEINNMLGQYDSNLDGKIDAQEIKAIKELIIDENNRITDFSDMYNLTSLQKITFKNVNLQKLDGLENVVQLNFIEFQNVNIQNYEAVGKVSKLQYLYMYMPNNEEVSKLCEGIKNAELSALNYFGLYGYNLPSYTNDLNRFSDSSMSSLTDISPLKNLSNITKESIKYVYLNNNNLSSIEALKDFKNIYNINLTRNANLKSLEGLENKKNLKYLYVAYTGIENTDGLNGCDEIYHIVCHHTNLNQFTNLTGTNLNYIYAEACKLTTFDGLENQNIIYLDCKNNSNLKSVQAIKDIQTIQELYLENCEAMITEEVSTLENIIIGCGSKYSIPSKYSICFNNTPRLDYSDQNLSDTSIEIGALKNKTSCTALSLKNCKNLSNEKLQEILSTMTGIQYLQLYGINNLTSIDFVDNMPNLVELDLRGTSVTDLSKLENNEKMLQLCIDNINSNLEKIPKTITRCGGTNSGWCYYFSNNTKYRFGLFLSGKAELLAKLGNITSNDFQKLTICCDYSYQNATLNLSNCTNLKEIELFDLKRINVAYPSSIEKIIYTKMYSSSQNTIISLGNLKNLKSLKVATTDEPVIKRFIELANGAPKLTNCTFDDSITNEFPANVNLPACETMSFSCSYSSSNQNVTSLENLDSAYLPKLKTLNMRYNRNLKSLKGIENLIALESLDCYNCGLTDISSLASCTNLKYANFDNNPSSAKYNAIIDISAFKNLINLTELRLGNNKVSSLKSLENCTKLVTLNLENNCIYDTSSYTNENGENITYNNLEILANLNRNGALRNLYLAGNSGIAIWTPVSSISNWTGKSGW